MRLRELVKLPGSYDAIYRGRLRLQGKMDNVCCFIPARLVSTIKCSLKSIAAAGRPAGGDCSRNAQSRTVAARLWRIEPLAALS